MPDHPYRILVIGSSGSGKTNASLNLINSEANIDKIFVYALKIRINKWESTGLKYLNDSKVFMEYCNDLDNIYQNIKEYNPNKKQKYYY